MVIADHLDLIRKYFRGDLSPQEQVRFNQLLEQADFQEEIKEFKLLHEVARIDSLREDAESLIADLEAEAPIEPAEETVKVVLVDDHALFRQGLAALINSFSGYSVLWEASNGKEFMDQLPLHPLPDVVLLDDSMPMMNGYQTALWLQQYHPQVKILALSTYDTGEVIKKTLRAGISGIIFKNTNSFELQIALNDVVNERFYISDSLVKSFANVSMMKSSLAKEETRSLSENEVKFLELACTELTYKEIADQMRLSIHTVEKLRETLFIKLSAKSRVGLVTYAIRNRIVRLN